MQLTIEIPDELAHRLEPEQGRLAAIIARGLRRSWSATSPLRREVIAFLASQPAAEEILNFRPSPGATERSHELLARHREGVLTPEEQAELDEMCEVDRFVSLIKAEVVRQASAAA